MLMQLQGAPITITNNVTAYVTVTVTAAQSQTLA